MTITTIQPSKTYHAATYTDFRAPGYCLEPGDSPNRWRIVSRRTGRNVALLVTSD